MDDRCDALIAQVDFELDDAGIAVGVVAVADYRPVGGLDLLEVPCGIASRRSAVAWQMMLRPRCREELRLAMRAPTRALERGRHLDHDLEL